MLRLAVIATVAGAFSGLFGVGGGAVMVPLLILWLAYEEREATGTSLPAIPLIAAIGVLVQGIHGNVHVAEGLLVGVPAIGGVLAGGARPPPRRAALLLPGAGPPPPRCGAAGGGC